VSPDGGFLSRSAFILGLLFGINGCVHDAVLDNDIARARAAQACLLTATDVRLAEAALSAQLVELEALYLRDTRDYRAQGVLGLLDDGYGLMAQGFIELRRLDAVAAGDIARAEQERQLQADAAARSRFYRARSGHLAESALPRRDLKTAFFSGAEAACQKHDRAGYERSLSALLAQSESSPQHRLELALAQRQAAAWLMPNVSARCAFEAPPTAATPKAPSPASR
jgi:hypothetical protein